MFDKFVLGGPALTLALAGCATQAQTHDRVVATGAITPEEWAQDCEKWDEWDKPAPPFKVHGDTYYVGTCGISAILIANDDGHILIDSGTENGADIVAENIRVLGFNLNDVRFLTHSHEHFDHVGGFAKMQSLTGALVIGTYASIPVLRSGLPSELDPQHGMHPGFTPLVAPPAGPGWSKIESGESISVNDFEAFAIETPGHSPGALSWYWESCDRDDCKTIVYADSLSPISGDDYLFSENPTYVALFKEGLERISELDCDILLTPHPSHSRMVERATAGTFVGGVSCREYADGKLSDLQARLDREAGMGQ